MSSPESSKDALLKRIEQLENEINELKKRASGGPDAEDMSYRDLVEHSPEGVLVLQDGKLVFYNRFLQEYIGFTDKELTQTLFTDFIHPDDVDTAVEYYTKMMNGEDVPSAFELRILSKENVYFEMEIYASFSLWMNKPAVFCYFREVSKRKKAERDLKISNERWKNLFENSIDANFTADLKGNITAANDAMAQILGYTKDELTHMNFRDLMDSQAIERTLRLFNVMFRTETPIMSGENPSMPSPMTRAASGTLMRSSSLISCPACRVASATHPNPNGSAGMLIRSVLADMNRTLIALLWRSSPYNKKVYHSRCRAKILSKAKLVHHHR